MPGTSQSQTKTVISADGTRIHTFAAGDASKPALVLVHGFASSSFAFSHQFANRALLAKLYLVTYDVRGNGHSDKPETPEAYAGARLAEDFRAVCEAFGVVRPVVLGWSLGGTILVNITNHLPPGYVRGMVYTGGAVPTRPLHAQYISPWLVQTLPGILSPDAGAANKCAVLFVDALFARPQDAAYEDRVRWLGEMMLAPPATRAYAEAQSRELDTAKWASAVKGMKILVIQGSEDRLVDGRKLEKVLRGEFGERMTFVWIDGAGHMPHWEKTELHDEAVLKYIESLGA